MNSGVLRLLYTNAFNDIELARNCQISISQKEMEINMININSRYSSFDKVYLNNIKKQSLELDIINMKSIKCIILQFEYQRQVFSAYLQTYNNLCQYNLHYQL